MACSSMARDMRLLVMEWKPGEDSLLARFVKTMMPVRVAGKYSLSERKPAASPSCPMSFCPFWMETRRP